MIKEITSKDHPMVKHFTKLRINRDFRHETGRVIIEGEKLVQDIIKNMPYQHLLVMDRSSIPSPYDPGHISFVTEDIMKKISGMENPPRMMAEVLMPSESDLKGLNFVIALDRLQDPGNIGAVFRTALALGWEGIFLIDDTVDPYNDKALRASLGASLILPWKSGTRAEFEEWAKEESMPVYIADLLGEGPEKVERGCLVLGQEGEGVQHKLRSAHPAVSVPMNKKVESLNVAVAGGILMYLLRGS